MKFYRTENDLSNQYYISIETRELSPLNREQWPEIFVWICERADVAAAVFPRWIKRIHAV